MYSRYPQLLVWKAKDAVTDRIEYSRKQVVGLKFMRFLRNDTVIQGITDGIGYVKEIRGDIAGNYELTGWQIPLKDVQKYLVPVYPSKIVGLGLNYRSHAEETGVQIPSEPLMFLKPPSALAAHGEDIIYPGISSRVDYEAELAIIIGKMACNISAEEAGHVILGYSCFNDLTARDLQKKDGQWTRAKSFDTFAPLGPWIEMDIDPSNLEISMLQNDRVVQDSLTSDLIFNVNHIVSCVSRVMTLNPGDVIATGTPSGIGPVEHGDILTVRIQGIGELQNRVVRPGGVIS